MAGFGNSDYVKIKMRELSKSDTGKSEIVKRSRNEIF